MKVTAESTDQFVTIDGHTCRVWKAVTEAGQACELFVHTLRVPAFVDTTEFDRDLQERKAPPVIKSVRR